MEYRLPFRQGWWCGKWGEEADAAAGCLAFESGDLTFALAVMAIAVRAGKFCLISKLGV